MFNIKYIKSGHVLQKYTYEKTQGIPIDKAINYNDKSDMNFEKNIEYFKNLGVTIRDKSDLKMLKELGIKVYKSMQNHLLENDIWWDSEITQCLDMKQFDFIIKQSIMLKQYLEKKKHDFNRSHALNRARNNVLRLINSNPCLNVFLTLTFADTDEFDITDIKQCNVKFKAMVRRIRAFYGDFKYVSVIEFQDKNGRGAVHYHLLCDLQVDFKPQQGKKKSKEQKIYEVNFQEKFWKMGFVTVQPIKVDKKYNDRECDNIGAYVTFYMEKSIDDKRLEGNKIYQCSKNLDKPIEFTNNFDTKFACEFTNFTDMNTMECMGFGQSKSIYKSSFYNEFTGTVIYEEYNLKRTIDKLKL